MHSAMAVFLSTTQFSPHLCTFFVTGIQCLPRCARVFIFPPIPRVLSVHLFSASLQREFFLRASRQQRSRHQTRRPWLLFPGHAARCPCRCCSTALACSIHWSARLVCVLCVLCVVCGCSPPRIKKVRVRVTRRVFRSGSCLHLSRMKAHYSRRG